MQTVKSVSWVRMVLAFAAILIVAGSGFALAAGPDPTYVPQSSVILGDSTIGRGATKPYVFEVTFVGGFKADFPTTMGATFSVLPATASVDSNFNVTATTTGARLKLNATFAANGVTTSASRFIAVQ